MCKNLYSFIHVFKFKCNIGYIVTQLNLAFSVTISNVATDIGLFILSHPTSHKPQAHSAHVQHTGQGSAPSLKKKAPNSEGF